MISCYKSVGWRPHVPRERILRRIINAERLDVDVGPSPQEPGSGRGFSESEDSGHAAHQDPRPGQARQLNGTLDACLAPFHMVKPFQLSQVTCSWVAVSMVPGWGRFGHQWQKD